MTRNTAIYMTPGQLAEGYAWLYARLFSHASIWRRRPRDWRAVGPYLAMSDLYKRSNRLWHLLIRHGATHAVWWPLVDPPAAPPVPAAARPSPLRRARVGGNDRLGGRVAVSRP